MEQMLMYLCLSVIHRRSLSEDVGSLVFSPHTAPSDKARCHLLQRQQSSTNDILTAKKIGEIMCQEDPHYKPRTTNPFAALTQFRGVKKILGGSPNSYTTGVGDLFSSCFEMPSPFFEVPDETEKSPKSVPGSPTASRKDVAKSTTKTTKTVKASSLFTHPLFKNVKERDAKGERIDKPLVKCSSSNNISDLAYDITSAALKRRGSCESGFFSSVGEDYHICPDFSPELNPARNISSATLSSSSAASSLFLLDDSATTVSSLRSLDDLDLPNSTFRNNIDLYGPSSFRNVDVDVRSLDIDMANRLAIDLELSNQITQRHPLTNQLLYSSKRASSIYTDSSEDISSLGGSDIFNWEEKFTGIGAKPQQISKIVEYFERKGSNFRHSGFKDGRWKPSPTDSHFDARKCEYLDRCDDPRRRYSESEYQFGKTGLKMAEIHSKMGEGQAILDYQRNSKIASLRKSIERHLERQHSGHCVQMGQHIGQTSKKCTQRLMICEGAVKSKLPLFDKK